jgi:hypothetical protein
MTPGVIAAEQSASGTTEFELPDTDNNGASGLSTTSARDLTVHLPTIQVGLRWLFDTEQPSGAVQCPAGDHLPSVGGRGFRFIPSSRDGRAAVGIAVTTGIVGDAIGGHELAAFIDLLEGVGEEVVAIDAVASSMFCTLTLARAAHPTLRRAVARYQAGYRAHVDTSPFGPTPHSDVATVSARDLQRLTAETRGVHWVDRIDSEVANQLVTAASASSTVANNSMTSAIPTN